MTVEYQRRRNPSLPQVGRMWNAYVRSGIMYQSLQVSGIRSQAMLIYEPNPKHETPGSLGLKGTKLDLSVIEATQLLNDALHCLEVPGRDQRIGVRNGKIYVFKKGSIGYHAYPISGNEVCAKFPEVQSRVASLLGTTVKRLSRM